MRKQLLNPRTLFEPRHFTHTVAVSGPLRLVYVSGQVSYGPDGAVLGKGDIGAQTRQVFECLARNLEAAGARWRDVVKLNGYMVRMNPDAVAVYREVRSRYLDAKSLPASTLVGVERLVHEDLLLEVELIAALPPRATGAKRRPAARKKRR